MTKLQFPSIFILRNFILFPFSVLPSTGSNGTARFFAFSILIEGTTEKVLEFIMILKSIYNINLVSLNKNVFFEHNIEFQQDKLY